MNFATAADELHRQERARLADAVTPRPEQLRSMTAPALRLEIAGMWERLGHDIITRPDAAELVTIKGDRKFITACANPADLAPAGSPALRRLRDRVVATSAERGFFVSVRGFTDEARHYAEAAPVELIDSAALIRALQRSRKGMLLPQTYKAMCRQCGDIVHHKLDSDEAKRCGNGHFVAPTIARPDLIKPRIPAPGQTTTGQPTPASKPKIVRYKNMSATAQRRRKIKAHSHQMRARAINRQQTAK
jgi:Restriction endonuclease